jgi:microcystin-dependent protein
MSQPYVGEIRLFAGSFNPNGWAFCDGALLPISENDVLFNLIGTTYGGDGQENFALPDLRGRVPMHFGNGFTQAETGGVEQVTLTVPTITSHTHAFIASTQTGTGSNPGGNVMDQTTGTIAMYIDGQAPDGSMAPGMIGPVGGSQPHNNLQPFLCVNFIISLFGIFPSQT